MMLDRPPTKQRKERRSKEISQVNILNQCSTSTQIGYQNLYNKRRMAPEIPGITYSLNRP
jgi:hypothetical protein